MPGPAVVPGEPSRAAPRFRGGYARSLEVPAASTPGARPRKHPVSTPGVYAALRTRAPVAAVRPYPWGLDGLIAGAASGAGAGRRSG